MKILFTFFAMKGKTPKGFLQAFTLQELLVVLIIVGILTLLVLPNLLPLITKAKSTEAKLQLEHLYTLQKTYFYEHSTYTNDLLKVDYLQEKTVENGGSANYMIEMVDAEPSGFVAKATAVVDFDGDGVYNVWEIDQDKNLREVIKD